jgi:hypothetical protein
MRILRSIALAVLISIATTATVTAQTGSASVSLGTPNSPEVKRFFYDGSDNLKYVCVGLQKSGATTLKRSDSTLTNIVVSSNTATVTSAADHYLYPGVRITISGATVDTDLNGSYTILTSAASTTFTFTTASVADATYNEAGLVITTTFPKLNALKWAIQVYTYLSTALTGSHWAESAVSYNMKCSDRASY